MSRGSVSKHMTCLRREMAYFCSGDSLMSRSAPQPRSRKTPTGGMKMAKMILMMSLQFHEGQYKSIRFVCAWQIELLTCL